MTHAIRLRFVLGGEYFARHDNVEPLRCPFFASLRYVGSFFLGSVETGRSTFVGLMCFFLWP